jgi:hypothetical protein
MPDLSEREILDRHLQALGMARGACQRLGRQADPEKAAPRGPDYSLLKEQLDLIEGTCRQLAHYRGDARWLRLGMLYARTRRSAQYAFIGMNWLWFNDLQSLFSQGIVNMIELRDGKTGRASSSPILPKNPSAFLVTPDFRVPLPPIPKSALN